MFTTLVTFLTTRIVTVVIAIVVTVAAVPSLILLIHGHTVTIVTGSAASASRHDDDEERARLIIEVKTAGQDVIVLLNAQELNCSAQLAQLAKVSKLSATQTKAAIEKGKTKYHLEVSKFTRQIEEDEDEFEHSAVISTATQQVFLTRFLQVRITALGSDGTTGVLVTICAAIIVEIRKIVITVVTTGHEEDDD